ncbi:MAG: hypothetical protein AB1489_16500 [Acidobacteriota bacterium]
MIVNRINSQPLQTDDLATNLPSQSANVGTADVQPLNLNVATDATNLPSDGSAALRARNGLEAAFLQQQITTLLTQAPVAPSPLPEGQPDKSYDGAFVGANGRAYSSSTPLSQIPPVKPSDGREPTETLIYVNGIRTSKEGQAGSLQAIADKTGSAVIGIHNATENTFKDLLQSLGDKVDIGRNPAVDSVADAVYDSIKKGQTIHILGHSQGGLIVSRAIDDVRKRLLIEDGLSKSAVNQLLNNVKIETFGAAAASYPDGPQYVHYVNRVDPVPALFGLGPFKKLFTGDRNAGKGAVVNRFTRFGNVHGFEETYLARRVPFDQARRGQF